MDLKKNSKKWLIAIALLLLLALPLYFESKWGSFGGRGPAPALPKPPPAPLVNPEADWLRRHYPSLLTHTEEKALYESLIRNYWVPQTGIFLSFPRTADIRLVQQAATYDQGVIGILLLKLGDLQKAGKILSFYEAAWADAVNRSGPRKGVYGLANFYNAYFSVEGIEKTMHVGPNAWIGLLASRYYRRTGDRKARDLALAIAHWMIDQVPHTDGAIAMGQILWNSAPWNKIYSTENNLSTYAFLGDLLKAKGLGDSDRRLITHERDAIGRWLTTKAYQRETQTVLRGFHPQGLDRAGAIDSYTWFLASLRPDYLESVGIPTEPLIRRAEKDFTVRVNGRIGVDAVDSIMAEATYDDAAKTHYRDINFLRPEGDGHRLVWYEGTGQFIVALQDVVQNNVHHAFLLPAGAERDDLLSRAAVRLDEARAYTKAMDDAAVTTPDGKSYPCATTGRFYLYGWPAPEPVDGHLADASAPLVWRLFAGMGYEPLTDTQLKPTKNWTLASYRWRSVRDPGTALLYGASEEMMVWSWKLYEKGDLDGAERQAKATISLWEEDAHKLEKAKEEKVGTYLPFDGTVEGYQRIHDYWALNDVAACYFILGKIADQQKNYAEASGYLGKILKDFYLAQMWDKRGWFWNPVDSIQEDYVEHDPDHYGTLAADIPDIPALTAAQDETATAAATSQAAPQAASPATAMATAAQTPGVLHP